MSAAVSLARKTSTSEQPFHVGLDGAQVATADNIDTSATAWTWFRRDNSTSNIRTTVNVTTAGVHTVNVWMGDDGARIDAIYITRNATTTAPTNSTTNGGDWSFETNPDTYVGTTCNGSDNGVDAILDTGAKAQCNASWPAGKVGSQHFGGMAIDAAIFTTSDGTRIDVNDDWFGRIGAKTCGPDARPRRKTEKSVALRAILCETAAKRIFNVILTPNHNRAHRNHFHLDVTPGAKWFVID